jgi:hypothetical protein
MDARMPRPKVVLHVATPLTQLLAHQRPSVAQQISNPRLDPVDAPDGAGVSSDDGQTKYRVERHDSGGVTFHRRDRKLTKAERKALKRGRRR